MLQGMCKSIIGMANINATEIQAMKIPLPPLKLQREFARRVAALEKLKNRPARRVGRVGRTLCQPPATHLPRGGFEQEVEE